MNSMIIKAIIIPSTVDEIGMPSASIFTSGCNFDCVFCHNRGLIPRTDQSEFSDDDVIDMIQKSKTINCVVISGGEPLVQDGLKDFIVKLKSARNIKIFVNTNGSMPSRLKEIVDLVDGISMDIKSSFDNYSKVIRKGEDQIALVKESIALLVERQSPLFKVEFRTTVHQPFVGREQVISIARYLQDLGFKGFYAIQQVNTSKIREEKIGFIKTDEILSIAGSIKDFGFKVFARTLDKGFVGFF